MDALDTSDDLLRRSAELRARSEQMRAAAAEKMDKSARLIAAAAKAREAVIRAYGWQPAVTSGRAASQRSRHGEHPGVRVNVAETLGDQGCQRPRLAEGDARHLRRVTTWDQAARPHTDWIARAVASAAAVSASAVSGSGRTTS